MNIYCKTTEVRLLFNLIKLLTELSNGLLNSRLLPLKVVSIFIFKIVIHVECLFTIQCVVFLLFKHFLYFLYGFSHAQLLHQIFLLFLNTFDKFLLHLHQNSQRFFALLHTNPYHVCDFLQIDMRAATVFAVSTVDAIFIFASKRLLLTVRVEAEECCNVARGTLYFWSFRSEAAQQFFDCFGH